MVRSATSSLASSVGCDGKITTIGFVAIFFVLTLLRLLISLAVLSLFSSFRLQKQERPFFLRSNDSAGCRWAKLQASNSCLQGDSWDLSRDLVGLQSKYVGGFLSNLVLVRRQAGMYPGASSDLRMSSLESCCSCVEGLVMFLGRQGLCWSYLPALGCVFSTKELCRIPLRNIIRINNKMRKRPLLLSCPKQQLKLLYNYPQSQLY